MRERFGFVTLALVAAVLATLSCADSPPAPGPNPPVDTPPPAGGPPKPLETVTITITNQGFSLDSAAAAVFTLETLRVYQGSRLTFLNRDTIPHDIQSGPPHIHTDCPEVAGAGFLVPGQMKSTNPLDRLVKLYLSRSHLRERSALFRPSAGRGQMMVLDWEGSCRR